MFRVSSILVLVYLSVVIKMFWEISFGYMTFDNKLLPEVAFRYFFCNYKLMFWTQNYKLTFLGERSHSVLENFVGIFPTQKCSWNIPAAFSGEHSHNVLRDMLL